MVRKSNQIFIGVNDFLKELSIHKESLFQHRLTDSFIKSNNFRRLRLLICDDYWKTQTGQQIHNELKENTVLSNLLTGKDGHSAIKGIRKRLAKDLSSDNRQYYEKSKQLFISMANSLCVKEGFSLNDHLPSIYNHLMSPITGISKIDNDLPCANAKEYVYILDIFHKDLLYLHHAGQYSLFFWWLFLYCLMQKEIIYFLDDLPSSQYSKIINYLNRNHTEKTLFFNQAPGIYICEKDFWNLRRELVRTIHGKLIIAGPSLRDAFNMSSSNSIVKELIWAVNNNQLTELTLMITDPEIFDAGYNCGEPIRDVTDTMENLQERFYHLFEENQIPLNIYFLPFLQIDHAVITDEFMVFRSNKLWNRERKFKGAFFLHTADYYTKEISEYSAHKDYLQTIMDNSTTIYPSCDIDYSILSETSARSRQMHWRHELEKHHYKYISLFKVYEKQIFSYVCNTWNNIDGHIPTKNFDIRNTNITDFFDPSILLNDDSQKILLPYLRETQELFNTAIKKHDRAPQSFCQIFPSLDLGFPNNVQRLAGGFATGMLVTWQCGIDIVPIDATVNVCTSSVFRLNNFDSDLLKNKELFKKKLCQIFEKASFEKGYSFSFQSGNHFLIIAQDKKTNDYYLVLHSSANELKNSYMGLYPVENNWYADKIKIVKGQNGRYFRYLKDKEARHFITMAMNFKRYNEQIHHWLADEINEGAVNENNIWMKHHYYMPTDQSIALGTFAEPHGTEVPIFSAPGKPIYIFKIGPDNWTVNLGGTKGKVCLVPHGWGQKIDNIQSINVHDSSLIMTVADKTYKIPVSSKNHIECPGKMLRNFKDGYDFLNIGSNYVQGEIIKELIPVFEYSVHNN